MRPWLALAVLCLSTSIAAGAEGKPAYTYRKAVEVTTLEREELLAVPLDSEVFARTTGDFADLRVVGPGGVQAPFIVRRGSERKPVTTRDSWTATNPNVDPLEGGELAIVVQVGEKRPAAEGLVIHT